MSLLSLALTIIVTGILLWVVITYVPMDEGIKKILKIVVGVVLVVYVLGAFGLFHHLDSVRVPQVR